MATTRKKKTKLASTSPILSTGQRQSGPRLCHSDHYPRNSTRLPNLDIGAIRMTLVTYLGDPLLRISFAFMPSQRITHIAITALPWSFPLELCKEYRGSGAIRHGLWVIVLKSPVSCFCQLNVLFCKISSDYLVTRRGMKTKEKRKKKTG